MCKTKVIPVLLLLLLAIPGREILAQVSVDIESGAVFSGYNDVRIPGDGGTLFSLSEELQTDPSGYFRLRMFYDFNDRHHLGALFAPLTVHPTGQLDRPLIFEGVTFPAGTPLEATYRFNSYRLIYRYDFVRKERVEFGLGFTAKIRDAEISVRGNGLEGKKTNVGFVPILHFRLLWKVSAPFALLVDGDALAAPQGRAEDVLAALTTRISDRIALKLGYRILEGGADNDEVYSFSLFHYAALGVIFDL